MDFPRSSVGTAAVLVDVDDVEEFEVGEVFADPPRAQSIPARTFAEIGVPVVDGSAPNLVPVLGDELADRFEQEVVVCRDAGEEVVPVALDGGGADIPEHVDGETVRC